MYLVNQIWDLVRIFVFNLYHDQYDCATGHIRHELPAILIHYSRRKVTMTLALKGRRDEVNDTVAELHRVNSWEKQLPFVEDHSLGKMPPSS